MPRNPVAKPIDTSHEDYDDVHADWVSNGRPHQFSRMGAWGGAIYAVYDVTAESPTFYQRASMGPTTYDETGPSDNPTSYGWYWVNKKYMRLKAKVLPDGRIRITRPEIPNQLG